MGEIKGKYDCKENLCVDSSRCGVADKIKFKMLVQDPLALNWARPQQAINIMKDTVEKALADSAENKDIKLLMTTYSTTSYDELVQYLSTIEPCVPRVLSEILIFQKVLN